MSITSFQVAPAVLDAGRRSVLDVAGLLAQLRLSLVTVRAQVPEWVAEGPLPGGLSDLLSTLDEAAVRCLDDVIAVSDALGRAAGDYQQVENMATARHQ